MEEQVRKENKAVTFLKNAPKRYLITAFSGMATGLFCTLIAGTILSQIAKIFGNTHFAQILQTIATFAKVLTGAGIGLGIALSLKANRLVTAGGAFAGFIGAYAVYAIGGDMTKFATVFQKGLPGDPITAYLCAVIACEFGMLVSGKTKVDILVVPLTILFIGGFCAYLFGKPVSSAMTAVGKGISIAAEKQPFIMGILVAVSMGLLLTLPTSSAAIGVAIGLNGIAAGAAVAGCCAHMVGFAVISFRENKWGGLIAQGLGTSMLQIPNLAKNIKILIPAIIASAICGPIASTVFKLVATPVGSGMGTAGLVGVIDSIAASLDVLPIVTVIVGSLLTYFILPAAIALAVSEFMRRKNLIKFGDMKIDV